MTAIMSRDKKKRKAREGSVKINKGSRRRTESKNSKTK